MGKHVSRVPGLTVVLLNIVPFFSALFPGLSTWGTCGLLGQVSILVIILSCEWCRMNKCNHQSTKNPNCRYNWRTSALCLQFSVHLWASEKGFILSGCLTEQMQWHGISFSVLLYSCSQLTQNQTGFVYAKDFLSIQAVKPCLMSV